MSVNDNIVAPAISDRFPGVAGFDHALEERMIPALTHQTLFSLGIITVLTLSCASRTPTPRPGTGDIAFRLTWKGAADLDLHVEEPYGQHIWFVSRESFSGGILDIDCNNKPDQICDDPIENIYWPSGQAPAGTYRYWVAFFQAYEQVETADYTVQVLVGSTVVESHSGWLTPAVGKAGPFEYRYGVSVINEL